MKKLRILIGPHEIGGQMQLMAEALRRRGHFATAVSNNQDWLGYKNDINIENLKGHGILKYKIKMMSFFIWAIQNYDVFHFFWATSFLSSRYFLHYDLPVLKRLKKKIVVHFRGSDIRNNAYFDYLKSKKEGNRVVEPSLSSPIQKKSLKMWKKYADCLLVSEPGLLRIVPDAIVVPQVIELQNWEIKDRYRDDRTFRICHAPTARQKKGTEYVLKAVSELQKTGYNVELILVEGVPANKVKEIYELCDVGIDQLLYGWHGKFSVEFMAMQKPVICYIDRTLLKFRPDLPIVSADHKTLLTILKRMISNKDDMLKIGRQGKKYVKQYHDVEAVVNKLLKIYLNLNN